MKRITIIVAILLSILSCRKDEYSTDQIVIDHYPPMDVNYIDHTIIGAYNSVTNYYLDIDKDGRNDYMFSSVLSGSPSAGVHPRSTISCLHDQAELFGEARQITKFLNIDTTNSTDDNNHVHANIAHNYTCTQLNQADSIVSLSTVNKIIPLAKDDVLKVDHAFFNDTLVIANDGWSLYNNSYTIGDTTYTIRDNYPNNCIDFPQGITTYIGIRLNGTELGWIQLAIYDEYKINILETAIKK